MKEVYLKITIAILFIVCAVLTGMTVLVNSNAHLTQKHIEELEMQKEELIKKVRKPSERFYFVTKNQTQILDDENVDPDSQIIFAVSEKDKNTAINLAQQVKEMTPAAVRDVFLAYLDSVSGKTSELYPDEALHLLKDQDTVILEEMCKHLNMEVNTKLCWDMQLQEQKRVCISTISMKKDDTKTVEKDDTAAAAVPEPVTFSYRDRNIANSAEFYCQDGIHTVVLGFDPIKLSDKDDVKLTYRDSKIPVGGHYTHLIEVHRAANSDAQYWYLEYEVPQPAEKNKKQSKDNNTEKGSADFHMNAISLLPGNPVISKASGSIHTFRVPFVNGVSKLLISANQVVFPKSLIASPNKSGDTFGVQSTHSADSSY